LARDGFPLHPLYSGFIAWRADVLKRSDYGRRTFFLDGRPLKTGERLAQPEVADLLKHLREKGAAWMYSGQWAREFLETVARNGGALTEMDLATYTPIWSDPWEGEYRGRRIQVSSSRSFGGPWLLSALSVASQTDMSKGRAWESVDALERDVRIAREVWAQPWMVDYRILDNRAEVERRVRPEFAAPIWRRVQSQLATASKRPVGAHSYQIIAADEAGNVVSGTHTINAEAWAEGLFVDGVALTSGGMIPWQTRPGERRLSGFTSFFVWDGRIQYAGGTISNSLVEAAFQLVVNLIDHRLPVETAVSVPRFGSFPTAGSGLTLEFDKNWLDPRIDPSFVRVLASRGLQLKQSGVVDTGLGAVFDAQVPGFAGAVAPVPYVASAFDPPTPANSN
jgi:gamma-glutamyltranspeptidase/glutathione hydrolase